MKILTAAFMLLFNYLDTLPKQYRLYFVMRVDQRSVADMNIGISVNIWFMDWRY